MKFSAVRLFALLLALPASAFAWSNTVVNMSHYDLMKVDFELMKRQGIVGVIHEATYPPRVRDAYYGPRQTQATRAGLLWGAYHFANATDPIRQAEHFLGVVASSYRGPDLHPGGVLLVLDFEKNGHYPGGSMTVAQAVTFVERIKQRTGKYPGLYGSEYRLKQMLHKPADHGSATQRSLALLALDRQLPSRPARHPPLAHLDHVAIHRRRHLRSPALLLPEKHRQH